MDPTFKFPPSPGPGSPLRTTSPARVNELRDAPGSPDKPLPPSPSLPAFRGFNDSHHRTGSDAHVLGMVARFNSLDIKDHRRDDAALKRSEMAREMAEMEMRKAKDERNEMESIAAKYREEARRLRKEIEEGRDRERKVAKRLDVVMDELHRSKDTSTQSQGLYEKEIRKARKEAFKSSSALVKIQEELKATRNSLRITQSGLESERMKLAKREQEAFTAQYQLVSVQEQLEKSRANVKTVEEERDALKTSLKEEEVARIAAEGGIALPVSHNEEDDEFRTPRKSPAKKIRHDSEDKENMMPPKVMEARALQEELEREIARRVQFEEQVDFMKMECQFQCCSCRIADLNSAEYVHDRSLNAEMERIKATVPGLTNSDSEDEGVDEAMVELEDGQVKSEPSESVSKDFHQTPEIEMDEAQTPTQPQEDVEVQIKTEAEEEQPLGDIPMAEEALLSPTSDEAKETDQTPIREPLHPLKHQLSRITEATLESSPARTSVLATDPTPIKIPLNLPSSPSLVEEDKENLNLDPSTPLPNPLTTFRTISHTTTIPLQFSPAPKTLPPTPSTISHMPRSTSHSSMKSINSSQENITLELGNIEIDRQAALEAIRMRRGRARSVANGQVTPRKGGLVGVGVGGERRDVSAPVGGRYGRGVGGQ